MAKKKTEKKKPIEEKWALLRANKYFRFFVLWLAPYSILLSFLFSEFLKPGNYIEIFPSSFALPLVLHAITALLIAAGVYFVRRPGSFVAKLAAVSLLAILFSDYASSLVGARNILQSLLPFISDSDDSLAVVSIFYAVFLFWVCLKAGTFLEKLSKKHAAVDPANITLGIAVVIGFVFCSQAIRVVSMIPTIVSESKTAAPAFMKSTENKQSEKPDTYYIVLDRYANTSVLQDQLHFDNSEFTTYLRGKNFVVNDNAYANYPYTSMSVASTMAADYTNKYSDPYKDEEIQSRTLYHNIVRQSPVVKAFKDAGYTYHNVGSIYGSTAKAPLADTDHMAEAQIEVFGKKKRLREIEISAFTQSIFHAFAKTSVSWIPLKLDKPEEPDYALAQLNTLKQLASAEEQGGRFIFSHILLPHPPYYFNADGSLLPFTGENADGKPINEKYLGQLQFINSQIKELLETIDRQSGGKAVVLLNADEGPYPSTMGLDLPLDESGVSIPMPSDEISTWPDEWIKMKYGIQQAARIPAATEEDYAHLTSVNAFRIILNRYLGYQLEYLPQCHLAPVDNNRQFAQVDVTERLTGTKDTYCEDLIK